MVLSFFVCHGKWEAMIRCVPSPSPEGDDIRPLRKDRYVVEYIYRIEKMGFRPPS